MPAQNIFLPVSEAHRAIIDRSLNALNAEKALYSDVEKKLGDLVKKRTLAGKAWNEMHESSRQCAESDAYLKGLSGRAQEMRKNVASEVDCHGNVLGDLLRPTGRPATSGEPPVAMVEAAWEMVLQGGGCIDRIRERNPAFLDRLWHDENARLSRELDSYKAATRADPGISSPAGDHCMILNNDRDLLLAQKESAIAEIARIEMLLVGRDSTIEDLQRKISIVEREKAIMRTLGEYHTGQIKGYKDSNKKNLEQIKSLEERVGRLQGELDKALEDVRMLTETAAINAPKIEDHEEQYRTFRNASDNLGALERALDTMVLRSKPRSLRYERSFEGRVGLLNGLGLEWRRQINEIEKRADERKALQDEISDLKESNDDLETELRIEKSKCRSAIQRCRVLAEDKRQTQVHHQSIGQRLRESNRRVIGQRNQQILKLEQDVMMLQMGERGLRSNAEALQVELNKREDLLTKMTESRDNELRLNDTLKVEYREATARSDKAKRQYAVDVDTAMQCVLLSIKWGGWEDHANMSAFNTLTSRLLPLGNLERQSQIDVPESVWYIANPYELPLDGVVPLVEDGAKLLPLIIKLYMLVDITKHCSYVGFVILQRLRFALVAASEPVELSAFMLLVELYVSKLQTVESLQGEEAVFAAALCQLWCRVGKFWPDLWRTICPQEEAHDPVSRIETELRKLDGFLQRLFSLLAEIAVRDTLVPSHDPKKDPERASFMRVVQDHFRGSMSYEACVIVAETESKYAVMIETGASQGVTLVEKHRFSFGGIGSPTLGLSFVLADREGKAKHRFQNSKSSASDESWRRLMGPFMNLSLAPEEVARRLELLRMHDLKKV